jgi:hypothetical protein
MTGEGGMMVTADENFLSEPGSIMTKVTNIAQNRGNPKKVRF